MPIYGRYKSKPMPGAAIDRVQPLSQAIDFCLPLNEGAGNTPADAARMSQATWNGSGSVSWGGSPAGAAATVPTLSYWTFSGPGQFTDSPFTIAMLVAQSDPTGNNVFMGTGTSGVSGWYLQCNVAGGLSLHVTTGGSTSVAVMSGGAADTGWHHLAVTKSDAGTFWYLDGLPAAGDNTPLGAADAASGTLWVNQYPGGGFDTTLGFGLIQMWGRELSAAEIGMAYADPWQVFGGPRPYGLYRSASGPSFAPWIYGDQIESNGGG